MVNKILTQPQNDYIDLHIKRHGKRMDKTERDRKKEARAVHVNASKARKLRGTKAKIFNKKRYQEQAVMKKTIKKHEEK